MPTEVDGEEKATRSGEKAEEGEEKVPLIIMEMTMVTLMIQMRRTRKLVEDPIAVEAAAI